MRAWGCGSPYIKWVSKVVEGFLPSLLLVPANFLKVPCLALVLLGQLGEALIPVVGQLPVQHLGMCATATLERIASHMGSDEGECEAMLGGQAQGSNRMTHYEVYCVGQPESAKTAKPCMPKPLLDAPQEAY